MKEKIQSYKELKVAICEDDNKFAQCLKQYIIGLFPDIQVNIFSSGAALLNNESAADIYLLDLDLPGMDGIETATFLRNRESELTYSSLIIFITGYDNKMPEAFDVQAYHYLVKPLSIEKFREVFTKAARLQYNRTEQRGSSINIKIGKSLRRVYLRDIKYADCYRKKITLHTVKSDISFYQNMESFESCLPDSFFRCHRGVIVNLAYIEKFDSRSITLNDGTILNLSRRKFPEFETAYLRFIKKEMVK